MPDSKGKKLADALYGQPEEKAAFGVFPQMKPRRSKQDPEAAKDVPRQLLRGWAAGTLGLPGDIEGLIRMLPGLDETPRLPTSEFYLDYLPGKAEGESGKTAAAAGTLFGGLGSTKAARGALEAGKGAAKLAERAAAMPSPSGLAAQRGVVKLPGGQWIGGDAAGSVQREAALLTPTSSQLEDIARLKAYVQRLKESNASAADVAAAEQSLRLFSNDQAIHDWVKSNLSNYIKKQMGTPDDPVRKLAEEGIVHVQPPPAVGGAVEMFRKEAGFPPEGMGVSPQARAWEEASDEAIEMTRAKEYQSIPAREKERFAASAEHRKILDESKKAFIERVRNNPDIDPEDAQQLIYATDDRMAARIMGREAELQEAADRVGKAMSRVSDKARRQLKENPWISKLEGETPVYGAGTYGLGFDHIIDVLRQDLAAGRIRPEQLNKVSMEQAVRRTYEYDQEMAKKMAEAKIKATEGMPVYKEYPEGYKWVELAKPTTLDKLPEGYEAVPYKGEYSSGIKIVDASGNQVSVGENLQDALKNWDELRLEEALKYEGETMGHCVGGYCPDVLEGRSRIYSLRDAKGEPHVTIEVQPAAEHRGFGRGGQRPPEEDYYRLQEEWLEGNRNGTIDPNLTFAEWWRSTQGLPEDKRPPQIVQIKGKQNLAPKEEYLPYVQDFVKGGQWSQVGDFKNTGLRDIERTPELAKWLKEKGIEHPRYLTEQEYGALEGDFLLNRLQPPPEGMKRGGAVMAAATIDGGEFVRVAEKYGLGSDNATLNKIVRRVNQGMSLDKAAQSVASSGKVHISDNPDTMRLELAGGGAPKAIAQRLKTLREQLAERSAAAEAIQARDRKLLLEQIPEGSLTPEAIEAEIKRMREEKGMAAGGAAKLAKLFRAPAKSKQEIEAIAERVAPQVTGEYVRKKPGSAITVVDKTKKQFEREKTLPVDIRATGVERTPQPVDIEKLKGEVMIGIAGDPTVTGKALHSVGDVRLESPAPQHGGPLYGLYHDNDHFWASGLGAARKVQNLAKEASQQYEAPVVGKYVMMGPDSINYALHFADANLQAIDLSKMSKRQIEGFNKLLRQGSPASGPRPNFPGIEDKGDAYLQFAFDPELRKHFNALMQQPTVTEKFGLPSGTDIRFAVTEPALRDLETGVTGYSMGRMKPEIPATELKLSEHPTYSHDIPGEFMGQSRYPIPYELSFPDTLKAIRENPAQAPYEFGSLKMVGPRQIVDQQMIDEIKAYEERMKQLTGKKKGGAVEKAAGGNIDKLTPRQMLYLSSSEDIAKLTPHQQREVVANMGGDELRQRMSGYFAKGGAVKKTKISDNPDTMRLELMKAKG